MSKLALSVLALLMSSTTFAQTDAHTAAATGAPTLSDRQIVKIVTTIDSCEIDAAKKAESKSQNADVKAFAKHMVIDHKNNETGMKDLAKTNKIEATDSDMSKKLKKSGETAYDDLKKADKASFDKTYINQQVTMHQEALDLLNTQLIPSAQNAELKAILEKTRDAVSAHLDNAKSIQAKL